MPRILNIICMFNPFFVSLCQQDTGTGLFLYIKMLFFGYSLKGLSYQILFPFLITQSVNKSFLLIISGFIVICPVFKSELYTI